MRCSFVRRSNLQLPLNLYTISICMHLLQRVVGAFIIIRRVSWTPDDDDKPLADVTDFLKETF